METSRCCINCQIGQYWWHSRNHCIGCFCIGDYAYSIACIYITNYHITSVATWVWKILKKIVELILHWHYIVCIFV